MKTNTKCMMTISHTKVLEQIEFILRLEREEGGMGKN
jgi:hypothetical protein